MARGTKPLWLNRLAVSVVAGLAILVAIGLYYYYGLVSQQEDAKKQYLRAMVIFDKQANEAIDGILRVFGTTLRADTLSEMLAIGKDAGSPFAVSWRKISYRPSEAGYDCNISFVPDARRPILELAFSGPKRNFRQQLETLKVNLRSDFRELIRRYAGDAEGRGFDILLVEDESGEVFLPEKTVGATKADLEQMANWARNGLSAQPIDLAGKPYLAFPREIKLDLRPTGRLGDVAAGGNAFETCKPTGEQKILAMLAVGLVRRQTLWAASRGISQKPVMVLVFILAAVVCSYPFVKLATLQRSESFKRRGVYSLFACALLLSAISITGILTIFSQASQAQAETDQMRILATGMRWLFSREWLQVGKQMEALERFVERIYQGEAHVRVKQVRDKLERQGLLYRDDLERAFFADDQGELPVYVSAEPELSPSGNVGTRAFFQLLRSGPRRGPGKEVIEPLRSSSTGRPVTVFARSPTKAESPYVAIGMVMSKLDLEKPRLTRGYSFAVVNGRGDVLYHHEHVRAGVENILDECAGSSELAEALSFDGERVLDATYTGRPFRMLVVPLHRAAILSQGSVTPAKLIILHDQRGLATFRWRLIAECAVLFAGLVLLLLIRAVDLPVSLRMKTRGWLAIRENPQNVPIGGTRVGWVCLLIVALGAGSAFVIYEATFARATTKLAEDVGLLRADSGSPGAVPSAEQSDPKDWSIVAESAALVPYWSRRHTGQHVAHGSERVPPAMLLLLACLLGVGGCVTLTRWGARRLLGLKKPDQGSAETRRILWLAPKGPWTADLGKDARVNANPKYVKELSMRVLADDTKALKALREAADILLIPDFGWEPSWMGDEEREKTLRATLRQWKGDVWLVSETTPEESEGSEALVANLLEEHFAVRHPRNVGGLSVDDPELVWKGLTTDERWVLFQVAQDGQFHPDLWLPAVELEWYGLLCFDPWPRICNKRFERFVAERGGELEPQTARTLSPRSMLIAGVMVLGGFLAFTFENSLAALTGALVAIGGLVQAVVKLDEYFRQSRAGTQEKSTS